MPGRPAADSQFEVLVIGAGIAGLSAACALARAGKRVAIVEARSRVGGRIFSIGTDGFPLPVELGAEFVHGKPPVLMELIARAGKSCFGLDGQTFHFENGQLAPAADDFTSVLERLPRRPDPDLTFSEWLTAQRLSPGRAQAATSYVEGFNAARADVIGIASLAKQQSAEDAIHGDLLFRIEQGYASLADWLLNDFTGAGGRVYLETSVQRVRWTRGNVALTAETQVGGRVQLTLSSRQCVVTLPLSLLQIGSVLFDPAPRRVFKAAGQMAMGAAKRIVFLFREPFWAARYPQASFLLSPELLPGVWWTAAPNSAPMLTGWIGGPRSQNPSIASAEALAQAGILGMAKIFSMPEAKLRKQLLSWHFHDWQADPFSRGAYSYVPKGALQASSQMAEPVDQTLFFAGEHTDLTGHWGTVHAALSSGLRAAEQLQSPGLN